MPHRVRGLLILGPWLQQFLRITDGNRHVTSLHKQATECHEQYETVLHQFQQHVDAFIADIRSMLSKNEALQHLSSQRNRDFTKSPALADNIHLEAIENISTAAAKVHSSPFRVFCR